MDGPITPATGPARPPVDVAVGVLVGRSGDGPRVFVTQRAAHSVYAGYWEFPGGKVEPGETLVACLAREFDEEVGLRIVVGVPIVEVEHAYAHGHVRLHAFYCALADDGPREPVAREVAAWRWVCPSELPTLRFPEANAPIIEAVMDALG